MLQKIKDITNGKGVNVILNSVAGNTFGRDFEALAPLGQIIWFGMAAGMPEGDLGKQVGAGFAKSAGIRTFIVFNVMGFGPRFDDPVRLDPVLLSVSQQNQAVHL